MHRLSVPVFALLCATALSSSRGESADLAALPLQPVGALLDRAANDSDPAVAGIRETLIARARADAAKPVIRRARSIADIETSRVALKPTVANARPENRETFALAMFDADSGSALSTELPRLAAAYRLTGDTTLRDRLFAQLAELATWSPLQRPGWTLGGAGSKPLPPGGDGIWLGTGWHLRGIADALDLLPPDEIPVDLRTALDALLDREIATILADWRAQRPWFVKNPAPASNQWVLPVEGLVRASLHRGALREDAPPALCDAYDFGVHCLMQSLDSQGSLGEFREGLTYAAITVKGLLSSARAMARAGDDRALRHPFLANTGTWFAHHIQPGGFLVNAFDTLNGARDQLRIFDNVFAEIVVSTGNPHALQVQRTRGLTGNHTDALIAATIPGSLAQPPPLFAAYPTAARIVWRSSWDDSTATGVWIRGGEAGDRHDHQDRGHVNFIIGRQPLLIEAGALNYATPGFGVRFRGVPGHNVLQIGDPAPEQMTVAWLARAGQILDDAHRSAPFTVHRLDADGGDITIDASRCYAADVVTRWIRRVEWNGERMRVRDDVVLAQPDIVLFRWHTGEAPDAPVSQRKDGLDIGPVRLTWETDAALVTRVEAAPDATLRARTISEHAVAIVRSREPVTEFSLTTTVELAR
ncbi:Heparinase II/III-like protein [Opitutaceae bacterium TAV1]|nr:Heparinase II/III-like protein [Opitutaceae bacterium TAV1]